MTSSFLRSKKQAIITWLIAFIIISIGIYLSKTQYLGSEWLSKSGCAIVLLGLWSALSGEIQEKFLSRELRMRRRNAIIRARASFDEKQIPPENTENEIHKIEEEFDQKATELAQRLKFSLGVLEFSLLVTGTFIWGFGDLFV